MKSLRLEPASSYRVLLIKCSRDVAPHERPGPRSPPLGIMYLSSFLKARAKYPVETLIFQIEMLADRRADTLRALTNFRPHLVGLSAVTGEAKNASDIAALVKSLDPRVPVVLGGPHATTFPHAVQDPNIDIVVRNEGEETFLDLFHCLVDGGTQADLHNVAGIGFKDGLGDPSAGTGATVFTPKRPLNTDLDDLPYPDWDGIRVDAYQPWGNFADFVAPGRRYGSMFTSRGCPYQCIFCHDVFGKRTNYRSAESILAEMRWLEERYGITDIQFVDDIFNLSKDRLHHWLDLIEREAPNRFHYNFPNGLRTDLLTREQIDRLARSGCYYISFAIESGNERVRNDLVKKHLDLNRVIENLKYSDEAGIINSGFFMIGFPGETAAEVEETLAVASLPMLDKPHIFVVIPHYGTPLFDLAVQQQKLPDAASFEQFHYSLTGLNLSAVPDDEFKRLREKAEGIFSQAPRMAKLRRKMDHWGLAWPAHVRAIFDGASPDERLTEQYSPPVEARDHKAVTPVLPEPKVPLPPPVARALERLTAQNVALGGFHLEPHRMGDGEVLIDLVHGRDRLRLRMAPTDPTAQPLFRTASLDIAVRSMPGAEMKPHHRRPLDLLKNVLLRLDGPPKPQIAA